MSTSEQPSAAGSPQTGPKYERFLDCVHCGLCTSACPTYLETGDENNSPRGRIYLMRAVVDGRLEMSESVTRHLDLCLDCRSCETACPSGVEYGRLIEPFRIEMRQQEQQQGRSRTNDWFHRWLLFGIFPHPRRLRATLAPARWAQQLGLNRLIDRWNLTRWLPQKLQRMYEQLPTLESGGPALPHVLPAQGERRARVALFTGCVADAMFRHVHWATARVLQANGVEVVVPRQQSCCGAIHYHAGAANPATDYLLANAEAFAGDEVDAVVVNVAGCGAMLKDYGHISEELQLTDEQHGSCERLAHKCRDISEFLSELGVQPPQGPIPRRVAYHDACHLAHAQNVRTQPRELLSLIPELELVPLQESDICCGAAGSYNLTEPEMADRLGRRKVENLRATQADLVATGNAGCLLQLQASLKREGLELDVYHPLQLLDWSYRSVRPEDFQHGR